MFPLAAPACASLPRVVLPVVGGGGRLGAPGRELRPAEVRADLRLAPEVHANEFLDFRLYRAAGRSLSRLLGEAPPTRDEQSALAARFGARPVELGADVRRLGAETRPLEEGPELEALEFRGGAKPRAGEQVSKDGSIRPVSPIGGYILVTSGSILVPR